MNITRKTGALAIALGSLAASLLSGCYSAGYVPARGYYYGNGGYAQGYYYNRPAYYGAAYAAPAYVAPTYAAPVAYARPVAYTPGPAYARPVVVAPRAGVYVRHW